MAWLVVGGTTIEVEARPSSSRETKVPIGQQRRAIDGTMRESIIARKREWSFTTGLLTDAEKATLESKLEATPPLSCSGDALGGAVNCHASDYEVEPEEPVTPLWRASFTLREA